MPGFEQIRPKADRKTLQAQSLAADDKARFITFDLEPQALCWKHRWSNVHVSIWCFLKARRDNAPDILPEVPDDLVRVNELAVSKD